jgi:hypothetical protein
MTEKLNAMALGLSGAIVSAVSMLVLGVFGNLGIYSNAVEMMQEMHLFFSLDALGIITGMIEAAVFGFVLGYAIALVYNKFA